MAATTPNMGLKVWNSLTDSFDHVQLAENFAKIDQHKHDEGHGVQIPTGGIADGAISAAKLGIDAVTDEKFFNNPVRGIVNGSTGTIISGTGFTASASGGNATITFTPTLPSAPVIFVTGSSAGSAYINSLPTATTAQIVTTNSAGTLTATIFHFIAYPV